MVQIQSLHILKSRELVNRKKTNDVDRSRLHCISLLADRTEYLVCLGDVPMMLS